jgi:hypothetical protein
MIGQYKRIETIKRDVNTRRYNHIVLRRKLRLASFVDAPILRKGFHSNPRLVKG